MKSRFNFSPCLQSLFAWASLCDFFWFLTKHSKKRSYLFINHSPWFTTNKIIEKTIWVFWASKLALQSSKAYHCLSYFINKLLREQPKTCNVVFAAKKCAIIRLKSGVLLKFPYVGMIRKNPKKMCKLFYNNFFRLVPLLGKNLIWIKFVFDLF